MHNAEATGGFAPLTGLRTLAAGHPAVAVAAATYLALLIAVGLAVLAMTGGTFMYSLDDPFIHLALAKRIAMGHYGINLGEVTSPSSSVLWPFLLVPVAATAAGPIVPLLVNAACGLVTAIICARIVWALPSPHVIDRRTRLAMAALLVPALNLIGLVYTGMEHSLQVLIAVAVAAGLLEVWQGRRLPAWTIALAILAPAIRYEMLAVTLVVAAALAGEQRWRDAVLTLAASLLMPLALSLFLVFNGASPLPNSVLTKLSEAGAPGAADLHTMLLPPFLTQNMLQKAMLWAMLALMLLGWRTSTGARRWIMAGAAAAALAHLLFGRFGWLFRYEIYILALCGLLSLWRLAEIMPQRAFMAVLPLAGFYTMAIWETPTASLNVYEQQLQMSRFAADYYRKPVAVNDLGLVAYRQKPSVYVLDLWGLASNEAARTRQKSPQWLDDVTRRHDTGLAMIFDEWFAAGRPRSWTRVGTLKLSGREVSVAHRQVAIYATAVGDASLIRRQLAAFKPTLPHGVELTITAPR